MNEGEASGQGQIDPAIIVIFGASGDLTQRKLIPALYTLYAEGHLGEQFAVVGVARSELGGDSTDDEATGCRGHLAASALKNARVGGANLPRDAFAEHPTTAAEYDDARPTPDSQSSW
jgi:hypothetical protein